jgi:muconolactone delta-isomerase
VIGAERSGGRTDRWRPAIEHDSNGGVIVLFFFSVRVDHSNMTADQLWELWEKEVDAAEGALSAGKIKNLYKVSGQRRVIGVIDADSHDELDKIFMAGLPMAHVLEWEEIIPVREYTDFGVDIRKRWQ